MTPTLDCSPLRASFTWTIKERVNGLWLPRLSRKNVQTNYGMTAYASGFQGSYMAPLYLVVETFAPTLVSLTGTTLVLNSASAQPTFTGDTQLVLSAGTAQQETVTFTGSPTVNGTQYTYTLTAAPTKSHVANDVCVRAPLATDTMTQVLSETAVDPTNFPTSRAQSVGGYSQGTGNWVMQFFLSGNEAQINLVTLGLADSATIGQGNLHNHLVYGYNHTGQSVDLEIDVALQLSNG